jgi:hypothetical protein
MNSLKGNCPVGFIESKSNPKRKEMLRKNSTTKPKEKMKFRRTSRFSLRRKGRRLKSPTRMEDRSLLSRLVKSR